MPATAPDLTLPVSPVDHAQGPADAPLTLVEYGDYECPNCVRTFSTVRLLQQELGERLRFVYRHFARSNIHAHASVAAEAAEAAGAQGKFWEMHDLLYGRTEALGDVDYDRLAVKIGIDLYRFRAELASGRWAKRVREHNESAVASGVTRTPTFFLNGRRLDAQDYDALKRAIDDHSASSGAR
jgi:protein-disulfide isomerase